MIIKPTVLILGAGASCPYGFPTGLQLKARICKSLNEKIGGRCDPKGIRREMSVYEDLLVDCAVRDLYRRQAEGIIPEVAPGHILFLKDSSNNVRDEIKNS